MKNIVFLLSVIFLFSCTSTEDSIDTMQPTETIVTIEFLTSEPNYDEVVVTYYDYKTDAYITAPYVFPYDSDGNPQPLKIILENYNFRYVDGEAYRNNNSAAELQVNLYINDTLVDEDSDQGTSSKYAVVKFEYTI
jgi:hypothetical protein